MQEIHDIIEIDSSADKEEYNKYNDVWLSGEQKIISEPAVLSQYMFYDNFDESATNEKLYILDDDDLISLADEFHAFLTGESEMTTELKDYLDTKLYNFIRESRDLIKEYTEAKRTFDRGLILSDEELESSSIIEKIKRLVILIPFNMMVTDKDKSYDGTNLLEILVNFIEYLTDVKNDDGTYLFEVSNENFQLDEIYNKKVEECRRYIEEQKSVMHDTSKYNNKK